MKISMKFSNQWKTFGSHCQLKKNSNLYAIKSKQGIPDWEMGGVLCHVSKKADLEECGISKNLGWQRDISLLWFYIL